MNSGEFSGGLVHLVVGLRAEQASHHLGSDFTRRARKQTVIDVHLMLNVSITAMASAARALKRYGFADERR